MEPLTDFPTSVDSTMLSAYRACAQKFFRGHIQCLQPDKVSIHLHAGGCFAHGIHTYRNAFYNDKLEPRACAGLAMEAMMAFWGDYEAPDGHAKSHANVQKALLDYFEEYNPEDDIVQPYMGGDGAAIEFSFGVPIPINHPQTGDPLMYSGRFDMLGVRKPKILCVVDEKTTGSISYNWADQWPMRGQFIGYCWGAQQYGHKVNHAVIRGVAIQKTQIKHAEAFVSYPNWLIERWYKEMLVDVHNMVKCYKDGVWLHNYADSCSAYGGCQYLNLCGSESADRWYDHYTVRKWDPLKKEKIA